MLVDMVYYKLRFFCKKPKLQNNFLIFDGAFDGE